MSKVLISSSSRYSIYKVQRSVLASLSLARTSIFYHNFKRLSRTFFKVFQSFPKPLSKALSRDRRSFHSSFRIISHSNPLVKNFFRLFSNFFNCFHSSSAAQCSLFSLPQLPLFVKTFFRAFSSSHSVLPNSLPLQYSVRCPRGQLAYINTHLTICQ